MAEISRLVAVVTADTADAEKGLGRVHGAVGGLASAATLAFAGAATAIAAGGVAAVKAAAGFEQTMSGVKAVSGATNAEMQQLSALALQLGKDTSFSASEAAAGIEELVKGGLSIGDVMGGAAKATLNLAAAGGVSLPEAAIIAANALAQFNLKGGDMAHVADLIAGAANASALDVGQFKFSLQAAGAVAATVGFSFDDLAQAIAVMGKAGITGSDAGTSLKTMMLNLQPSTKPATAAMRELGIITADGANAFFDAQGKVKSMSEVAGILERATRDLTEQQKLQKLQTIFGSDAIRAAAVFAKEGAAGFDEMTKSMSKITAEAVGTERLNNLNGALEQLKGSLETVAIEFGVAFLPVLKQAAEATTAFVNAAIPYVKTYGPAMVAALQSLFGAVRDVVGALVEMKRYVDDHKTLQAALAALVGATTAALGIQAAAWLVNTARLVATTAATTAYTAAQWLLNAALTANPIGIVVVALGALAGALIWAYQNSETFRRIVDGAFAAVRASVEAMWNAVRPIFEAFGGAIAKLHDGLASVSSGVANLPKSIPGMPTAAAPPAGLPGGITTVPIRDAGGPVARGGLYQIGQGPYREYFAPGASGMVYPAGGPTNVTVPVYIGGEVLTTVVARANQRRADRGGYLPRAAIPGPGL